MPWTIFWYKKDLRFYDVQNVQRSDSFVFIDLLCIHKFRLYIGRLLYCDIEGTDVNRPTQSWTKRIRQSSVPWMACFVNTNRVLWRLRGWRKSFGSSSFPWSKWGPSYRKYFPFKLNENETIHRNIKYFSPENDSYTVHSFGLQKASTHRLHRRYVKLRTSLWTTQQVVKR